MSENFDRVNPIRLTDNTGIIHQPGDVYELDFSRESIVFAEDHNFKLENVTDYPVKHIPILFYYSFRKNHKNVSLEKTNKFLSEVWDWKVPEKVLKRLILLYNQAAMANSIQEDEEAEKNEMATVEM